MSNRCHFEKRNNMRRRIVIYVVAALIISTFSGCSREEEQPSALKRIITAAPKPEDAAGDIADLKPSVSEGVEGSLMGSSDADNAAGSSAAVADVSAGSSAAVADVSAGSGVAGADVSDGEIRNAADEGEVGTQSAEEALELKVSMGFESLREEFPDGRYWNNGGISDIPCAHHVGDDSVWYCNEYSGELNRVEGYEVGKQCMGYASLISDRLFGCDAPVTRFYDYDRLRPGDHIRMKLEFQGRQMHHSMIVIEKYDDHVVVTDCNNDLQTCIIRWDAVYTRAELEELGAWYSTRY